MTADPTGRRFILTRDGVTAEIAQVGASLRALAVAGTDLISRYADDMATPSASGVVLVPWPNRISGGVWDDGGEARRLAITEPALGNASHGLLRFSPYTADAEPTDRVTLRAEVYPQTGYPFHLATSVTYSLTDTGVHVRHELQNVGGTPAPVALGTHPFVEIGGVDTADLVIRSGGTTRLVLDEKKIPLREEEVDADTDLRGGRRVGDLSLDTTYRGMPRDADGRIRHTLTSPDGRILTLWQGVGFEWAQVFTTDRYPQRTLALAIEPMTAPPNAFRTEIDLRHLAPGESWTLEWGIELAH
ncbi:aldose 1-epimerase family protein [Microbacterium sp. P06]|uniref:aldose 1-epimerase family protein n=1 Tax=unclassified Microbacterium TaxID=2609290 RepID=UPI0037457BB9